MRRWLARGGVSVATAAAALCLAELAMPVLEVGTPHVKLWAVDARNITTCYSTQGVIPFPLDLRRSARDREALRRITSRVTEQPYLPQPRPPVTFEDLVRYAPYCLPVNLGARSVGPYPDRPDQVILLGDSFVLGEGVPLQQTLGFHLARHYPTANFLNWGLGGDDLGHLRDRIAERLPRERKATRYVLYFFNLNDVFLESEGTWAPDVAVAKAFLPLYEEWRRPLLASRLGSALVRHRLQQQRSQALIAAIRRRYLDRSEEAPLQRALRLVDEIRELARAHGSRFALVIYPLLYRSRDGSYPFAPLHEVVLGFCRDNKLRCLDGRAAFAGQDDLQALRVHLQDSHPNGRANALMAAYVAREGILELPRAAAR